MLQRLENIDQQLFLFFNALHSPTFDSLMFFITGSWFWLPFIIYLIWMCYRRFSKWFWLAFLILAFCFLCTDQISGFIKNAVERYRPSHNLSLTGQVHLLNGYTGGLYGFVSSHAANSFGLAVLAGLLFRNSLVTAIMLAWAILVSYSRIYAGVHYPSDIIAGAITGIFIAWIIYFAICRIPWFVKKLNLRNPASQV
ncbi:MAG: phosphatase PAP2 family protein [Bacteroidales bacterium]|nr:phosphatase PAP2 family protein [Bacteroidales bacterium]HOY39091.1 phosphatase PAP2 family protein [Bacteroidales bacterium]HQP04829.1 phosphatase PAP2 family protein [Bacteroidales bacterium]